MRCIEHKTRNNSQTTCICQTMKSHLETAAQQVPPFTTAKLVKQTLIVPLEIFPIIWQTQSTNKLILYSSVNLPGVITLSFQTLKLRLPLSANIDFISSLPDNQIFYTNLYLDNLFIAYSQFSKHAWIGFRSTLNTQVIDFDKYFNDFN